MDCWTSVLRSAPSAGSGLSAFPSSSIFLLTMDRAELLVPPFRPFPSPSGAKNRRVREGVVRVAEQASRVREAVSGQVSAVEC